MGQCSAVQLGSQGLGLFPKISLFSPPLLTLSEFYSRKHDDNLNVAQLVLVAWSVSAYIAALH